MANGALIGILIVIGVFVVLIPTQNVVSIVVIYNTTTNTWDAGLLTQRVTIIQYFGIAKPVTPNYGNIQAEIKIKPNNQNFNSYDSFFYVGQGNFILPTYQAVNTGDTVTILIPSYNFQKVFTVA